MIGPLKPWKYSGHPKLYVDVDNSELAFAEFRKFSHEIEPFVQSICVLVSGPDGCGKTSLIHRCVSQLLSSKPTAYEHVVVVDRSAELSGPQSALGKCEDIASALVRDLKSANGALGEGARGKLAQIDAGMTEAALRYALRDVAAIAAENRCLVLLILPRIEVRDEARLMVSAFCQTNIALFVETRQTDVAAYAVDQIPSDPSLGTVHLQVGPINSEHAWRYVAARMDPVGRDERVPKFSKDVVNRFMAERTSGSAVSIREVQRVFSSLFHAAVEAEKTEITFDDFARLYIRAGGIG